MAHKPEKFFTIEVLIGINETTEYQYELTVKVNGIKAEVFKEQLVRLEYGARKNSKVKEKRLYYTAEEESTHHPGIATYFATDKQGYGQKLELNKSHIILAQVEILQLRKKEIHGEAKKVLADLLRIFVFDPIPSHMRQYAVLSDKLQMDAANISGVLAGLNQQKKQRLKKL